MSAQLSPEATVDGHGHRPTSGDHSDALTGPIPAVAGQWRPVDPHRARTPKQEKRALRKDHRRRRRILERAQADPTLTANAVRVLGLLLEASDDTAKPVWPKMATLAAGADIALRSARRCVAELETAGYVMRFMRPLVGQRRNLSNIYYFRLLPRPIPRHRPDQRRRPRRRPQKPRSHRRTLETGGTDRFIEPPGQAGAAKAGPPPRHPGQRRNLPPPDRRPPLAPIQKPKSPPPAKPAAVRSAIDAARSRLRPLDQQQPIGPYGPKRRPASGGPGFSR
jgi:hypothetical protein